MNSSFFQFISANHLTLAAGCVAGVGMCFFFCGVQLFTRKHSSTRPSKVTVSAVTPGLAAIAGKAAGPRTLAAPISGKPCYVYRTSIWQLHESVGKKEWKNVAEETGHHTFVIEDETGELLVEPSGAELDLRQSLSEEYGSPSSSAQTSDQIKGQPTNRETVPDAVSNFLARNGITLDRPTRVEEYCLQPEMPVSVTGTIAQNSDLQPDSPVSTSVASSGNQPRRATGDSPVHVSVAGDPLGQQPEVIRLASGAAPQSTTQMSQQAKIAAALAKAGLAPPDMWATVEVSEPNDAARTNGHPKPRQSQPDSTSDPTSTPTLALAMTMATTMTMMRGTDDPTFIISNRDQHSSPIPLGWKSVALVLAGSTLTTLSLYVLLIAHLR